MLGHINDSTEPLSTATLNNVTYQVLSDGFGTGVAGRLLYTALRTTAPAHLVDIFKSGGFVCSQQSELLIPFGATPLGNDTTASRYCGQVS